VDRSEELKAVFVKMGDPRVGDTTPEGSSVQATDPSVSSRLTTTGMTGAWNVVVPPFAGSRPANW
jgi:hypothetical protein